eukprot:scaffold36478_cov60-Phaeocystis_antarctica.AAC.4
MASANVVSGSSEDAERFFENSIAFALSWAGRCGIGLGATGCRFSGLSLRVTTASRTAPAAFLSSLTSKRPYGLSSEAAS